MNDTNFIANLGIPGAASATVLACELARALALCPEYVVLLAGTNDMTNPRALATPGELAANLGQLAAALSAARIKVLFGTLPPCCDELLPPLEPAPKIRVETANRIIRALANQYGCGLVDFAALFEGRSGNDASSLLTTMANAGIADGLHPTAEAYRMMAELVAASLPEPAPHKIVCMGDSITYGAFYGAEAAYPAQLGKILKLTVLPRAADCRKHEEGIGK